MIGTVVVTTGEAVAVADITGVVVAVVWTMRGVGAMLFPFWHLIAVMMMTSMITIMTAAPLDPMIGTLWSSHPRMWDIFPEKDEQGADWAMNSLIELTPI